MSGWALVWSRARVADTAVAAAAVLLATACLAPLYVDLSWLPSVVVVVVVIFAVGAAGRALALPLPLIPLIEGLALVVTVTAQFATSEAWGRFVPTSPAWDALRAHLQQGVADAQALAAPVSAFPGLVLLAVGGVGLVALSVDTVFVSVRAPVFAGIGLLALYLAPALILGSATPWWSVAPPATGWLLILAAEQRDRVRQWGGLADTTRIRGLSSGARRIGVVAVVAATALAIVLPVRTITTWRTGDGSGGGTAAGGGPVILDPLVSMRRNLVEANDTEVLTYRTQAVVPSYLRLTVLEDFDGTTWRPRVGLDTGRDAGVPLPGDVLAARAGVAEANRVTGGDSYTYDLTVTNLENAYLPLPYPVSAVTDVTGLATDWRMDPATGVGFSDAVPATGLAYAVTALEPRIEPVQLRDALAAQGDFWPQLNLPAGLAPEIKDTAVSVTSAAATPYDKAMALQRWFTRDGGFEYSTDVRSGADADYLAEFLRDRIGYCEQFAATMAVMARTLGIPSRVAVGFTQGAQDDSGTWHVTVRDAHAWPELWFEGVGWARFEPTPRSGGTVLTPAYARVPNAPTGQSGDEARRFAEPRGLDQDVVARPTGANPVLPAVVLLLGTLVVGLLATPMVRRRLRRHRRLRAPGFPETVEGAWAEIADLAVDLGQPWSAAATVRQAADRLSRGMPAPAAAALRRLRQEVEQVRYAPPPRTAGGALATERSGAIRADVRTIEAELRGRVRWQTRLLAYCWPSSERRRQRSSMRSMKPGDLAGRGPAGLAGVSSTGRAPKAE